MVRNVDEVVIYIPTVAIFLKENQFVVKISNTQEYSKSYK